MQTQALYDLSPLWQVLLIGAVLACLPVVWLGWRKPSAAGRLQALTVLTLFLTFDLVMFGAFTRLTDSGLGCPDWPGCYGTASPMGAAPKISAALLTMPTGPVSHAKAWIEMLHRYLATGVGGLIVVSNLAQWVILAGNGVLRWRRRGVWIDPGSLSPWWAALTLFWVALQGAFGALTVTMKLFPAIVTLHLLGGVMLLALLAVQAVHFSRWHAGTRPQPLQAAMRASIWLVLVLLGLQVALGGWVSTNYAVLACNEFPKCQGSWWPLMDFAQGFSVWRELGMKADGGFLGFEALTAIHYAHRLFAYLVLAALLAMAWRLSRVSALRAPARWLAWLALAQFLTGLSNVVLDWPLVTAVLHTGGAAALVVVLVWTLSASSVEEQELRS